MELILSSTDVESGGTITGKIKLELNKPKKAKELRVELVGWRRKGRKGKIETVYKFKKVLGGEQTYESREYEFQLKAPIKTQFEKKAEEGIAGAILGAATMLGMTGPVEWYVIGTLDIPMSMDITKKVQITIV